MSETQKFGDAEAEANTCEMCDATRQVELRDLPDRDGQARLCRTCWALWEDCEPAREGADLEADA